LRRPPAYLFDAPIIVPHALTFPASSRRPTCSAPHGGRLTIATKTAALDAAYAANHGDVEPAAMS
jgi:hypothetical protein